MYIYLREQNMQNLQHYPHVEQHFGEYLTLLVTLRQQGRLRGRPGHFEQYFFYPDRLEQRLAQIEQLNPGLTTNIMAEVSLGQKKLDDLSDIEVTNWAKELDSRLINAWAELRTVSQLYHDGFEDISKYEGAKTVDFFATRNNQQYAIQVTRRITLLREQKELQNNLPWNLSHGRALEEIYNDTHLSNALYMFFRKPIREKNRADFKTWAEKGYRCCVVIVTSDEDLTDDDLLRHITCQQISKVVEDIKNVEPLHFHELLWLPNITNGAWFILDTPSISCWADWQTNDMAQRHEIDLNHVGWVT